MLVCLTANHQNASFDLLEKLAVIRPDTAQALIDGADAIDGAVILNTCNRYEAYLDVADTASVADAGARAIELLSEVTGVAADALSLAATTLVGDDVVPHLFSVSAGLKSVVIGEDEIAGQVRRSLEHARETGTVSPELERLFQVASRTSKGVKSKTALGKASRSLVRLALELASSRVADWAETRVLLVGTGQYAATSVAALRDRGAVDITVFSPSGRAAQFASRQSVTAATSLEEAISAADVVLTCTSNEVPVVTPEFITDTRRRLVIDLGLPRNVDPSVAGLAGIELLDLETIRLHAPLEELNATSDAHGIVDDAVAEYEAAIAERSTVPAIVALRKHMFELLEAEIARSKHRGTWSQESEATLRHLVGAMLHTPSTKARELARSGDGQLFVDAIGAVFGIRSALDTSEPAGIEEERPA